MEAKGKDLNECYQRAGPKSRRLSVVLLFLGGGRGVGHIIGVWSTGTKKSKFQLVLKGFIESSQPHGSFKTKTEAFPDTN